MALLFLAASSRGEAQARLYDVDDTLQDQVGLASSDIQMWLFQNSLPTTAEDGSAYRWWVTQVDSRTGPHASALFSDLLRVLGARHVATVRTDLGHWISAAAQLPGSREAAQVWNDLKELGYGVKEA